MGDEIHLYSHVTLSLCRNGHKIHFGQLKGGQAGDNMTRYAEQVDTVEILRSEIAPEHLEIFALEKCLSFATKRVVFDLK